MVAPSTMRRRQAAGVLLTIALLGVNGSPEPASAQEPAAAGLSEQLRQAQWNGDHEKALELASEAVQKNPRDLAARLVRAPIYDELRRHREAIGDYDAILREMPNSARVYYLRGRSRFKAADVTGAIEDFDRVVRLDPSFEKRLWERGIAYYYAGEYAAGARQFEAYQAYDASDVENVVWRYLCQARAQGVEQASRDVLPLDRDDRRIPMMKIYALYRGEATPDEVLAAAREGDPGQGDLQQRLFYAHLYIGLHFEAAENHELAKRHLTLAHQRKISHYMWDVAHVHLATRGWDGGDDLPQHASDD